jgi:uncharacterized repeat protein (TIGR03843 family)
LPFEHRQNKTSRESNEKDAPILLREEDAVAILTDGVMRERGLLPYSSNHSFLVTITLDPSKSESLNLPPDVTLPAVYKPQRGESPLWDFEWGSLCSRETAAYEISRLLGWQLVPPTVLRKGTRGLGSVQLYIDHDEEDHYFTVQADARYTPAFRRMALFDFVINNADRKSGHCLVGSDGQIWAIDHGVCLHEEYKLRTVIWEFGDVPIEPELLDDLVRFRALLDDEASAAVQTLCRLLSSTERYALQKRVADLIRSRRYPMPDPYRRNFPWPPI